MPVNLVSQLLFIAPELLLLASGLFLLIVGTYCCGNSFKLISISSLLISVAALIILLISKSNGYFYSSALYFDEYTRFLKALILIGLFFAILNSFSYAKEHLIDKYEMTILFIFAALGMMIMVSACNMLTLYLGLELQSLSLYALAAFNQKNIKSSEAGMKYFILGALSSGFLLYGISLIYGFTGQIGFSEIMKSISEQGYDLGIVFGFVFILVGLAFKISSVPFHMWTPDVYEGSPTNVTAFFAGAPKIAALGLMTSVIIHGFANLAPNCEILPAWKQILIILSVASMLLGAFAAIAQTNIKRLLAYSSISHMGYVMVALLAGDITGVSGLLLYCLIYLVTTIGIFSFIMLTKTDKNDSIVFIGDIAGLASTNPFIASCMTILLFSLAGIPPLAGFFAKWYAISAAVHAGFIVVPVIAVISSVISAFYYLRVIKIMWFDNPKHGFSYRACELKLTLFIMTLFSLAYIIFAGILFQWAYGAASCLFI